MKVLRFALIGLCLSSGLTFAQEGKANAEAKAERMVEKMAENLELSDEQREKVEAVGVEMIQTKQKIKHDETISEEVQKEQLKALKETFNSEMKEILSEEQYAKFKENHRKNSGKSLEEKARAKADRMTEELGLSEEQNEQVYQLNLKVANKIKAIKERDDLSDEKKKEFIKGNKKDYKSVLSIILTEEQMTKLKELKAEKKEKKEITIDKVEE